MTAPTIYTFPDINPIGFTWSIETSKRLSHNDFTGAKEQSSLLSHRWRCQITMGSLSEIDTCKVISFLSRMADESALFKIFDYKTRNPLGRAKEAYDLQTPKPYIYSYQQEVSSGTVLHVNEWVTPSSWWTDGSPIAFVPGDIIGFVNSESLYSKHIIVSGISHIDYNATPDVITEEENVMFDGIYQNSVTVMRVSPPMRVAPAHQTDIIVNDVPVVMQINPETVASWSTKGYVYEDQVIDCFEYIP